MILREFQKNNKIPIFEICLLDLSKTIRFSYWVKQVDILRVRKRQLSRKTSAKSPAWVGQLHGN